MFENKYLIRYNIRVIVRGKQKKLITIFPAWYMFVIFQISLTFYKTVRITKSTILAFCASALISIEILTNDSNVKSNFGQSFLHEVLIERI